LKRNIISVGTLEALGHGVSVRDSVLKMTRGSMIMLKGVWCNDLYYLMGSTVKGLMTTSNSSNGDCTQVRNMRPGHTKEMSLLAPAKKESLESASTCNIELSGHDILVRR